MPPSCGVDAVVHLAALVGYPACRRDVRTAVTTNVEGTRLLLELRHPDQAFLFASTGSVYGSVPEGLCTELTDNAPLTLYGESKSIGEKLVDGGATRRSSDMPRHSVSAR